MKSNNHIPLVSLGLVSLTILYLWAISGQPRMADGRLTGDEMRWYEELMVVAVTFSVFATMFIAARRAVRAGSWVWLAACVLFWPMSYVYTLAVERGAGEHQYAKPLKDSELLNAVRHYLVRGGIGALVAVAVWAATFLPLGTPLTPLRSVGVGAFLLSWLYVAVAAVQLLRSLVKHWRTRGSAKAWRSPPADCAGARVRSNHTAFNCRIQRDEDREMPVHQFVPILSTSCPGLIESRR